MSTHGPAGRKTFTPAQQVKIRKDREKMTLEVLQAKWGGSAGYLYKICKGAR
jgi:hypothetical protein